MLQKLFLFRGVCMKRQERNLTPSVLANAFRAAKQRIDLIVVDLCYPSSFSLRIEKKNKSFLKKKERKKERGRRRRDNTSAELKKKRNIPLSLSSFSFINFCTFRYMSPKDFVSSNNVAFHVPTGGYSRSV